MMDNKTKLLEEKAQLEQKIHLFLTKGNKSHDSIVNKYKNELQMVNEKLALLDGLKDVQPIEGKKVDTVLQKMVNEFEYYMDKIELLKSGGRDYKNFFNKLQEINSKIDSRLLVLEKVDNLDTSDMLSPKVKQFRNKVAAIDNELQKQALEEKRMLTELSEKEKSDLLNASLDIGIGLEEFESTVNNEE